MSVKDQDGVLGDITNAMANTKVNAVNEAAAQRARDGGWVEPTKFDYDAYNAKVNDNKEAIEVPAWAATAAKYEWSDEYGDVGPEDKRLEEMLFGDPDQMKQGEEFAK